MENQSYTNLKSCPFCGGDAELSRYGTNKVSCIVICTCCGCTLETSETFSSGDSWNLRSLTPAQMHADEVCETLQSRFNYAHDFAFESWINKESPSGDSEGVQKKWLTSSDYLDFIDDWESVYVLLAKVKGI